jgi:hypothetical protein
LRIVSGRQPLKTTCEQNPENPENQVLIKGTGNPVKGKTEKSK